MSTGGILQCTDPHSQFSAISIPNDRDCRAIPRARSQNSDPRKRGYYPRTSAPSMHGPVELNATLFGTHITNEIRRPASNAGLRLRQPRGAGALDWILTRQSLRLAQHDVLVAIGTTISLNRDPHRASKLPNQALVFPAQAGGRESYCCVTSAPVKDQADCGGFSSE